MKILLRKEQKLSSIKSWLHTIILNFLTLKSASSVYELTKIEQLRSRWSERYNKWTTFFKYTQQEVYLKWITYIQRLLSII